MPSSIRPTRDSNPRIRAVPEEVTIDDWPLRDRPVSSSLAITLAVGASWLVIWATRFPPVGGIVGALLALTLWRTWLPLRYELSAEGVVQSAFGWRRRIAWGTIRHYQPCRAGVLLSSDGADSPASPLRGL